MRANAWWVGIALLLGCRGDDPKASGLPPATEWNVRGSTAPQRTAGDDSSRFTTCLIAQLADDPVTDVTALVAFARSAPAEDARRVILAVVDQVERFPAGARPKMLGEAAWALVDAGAGADARAVALRVAALPPDGQGGRITALATLGRIGAIADASKLATDMMARDVIAFGAAVGGHRKEAIRLRTEIEADPAAHLFVRSAIHLKLLAALGDIPAITAALADRRSPSLLLDAGAVVEGGAYTHNTAVMLAGVTALAEARGVSHSVQARALLGAAGTAAASARDRAVVDAAIAAFERLPATARSNLELVPAVSYATAGAIDEARHRFTAASSSSSAIDRAMVGAGIAAMAGAWDELPEHIPPSALLTADIWSRAIAAKLDRATRARVLDAVCPR